MDEEKKLPMGLIKAGATGVAGLLAGAVLGSNSAKKKQKKTKNVELWLLWMARNVSVNVQSDGVSAKLGPVNRDFRKKKDHEDDEESEPEVKPKRTKPLVDDSDFEL